jgi:PAS domain S-box-containing protein
MYYDDDSRWQSPTGAHRTTGASEVEWMAPAQRDKLLQALLDLPTDAIVLVDREGTIQLANATYARRIEKRVDELIGSTIWEWYAPAQVTHCKIMLNQVIATGAPVHFVDQRGKQWNAVTFYPLLDATGRVESVLIHARDITAQIDAEEKLKRAVLHAITIQEDERRRISQDLHDDLGQSLTALILNLKSIDSRLTLGQEEVGTSLKNAIRNVENLMRQIRLVLYQLRPPSLDTLPLPNALELFCGSFAQLTGLRVDFSSQEGLPPIPPLQATALYRLVQEGLNNAAKHARATAVWVNLDYTDGEVSVSVEDNGQGFDPLQIGRGLGLQSIRDRFAMLNGTFDVESVVGKGTRLFGALPLTLSGEA